MCSSCSSCCSSCLSRSALFWSRSSPPHRSHCRHRLVALCTPQCCYLFCRHRLAALFTRVVVVIPFDALVLFFMFLVVLVLFCTVLVSIVTPSPFSLLPSARCSLYSPMLLFVLPPSACCSFHSRCCCHSFCCARLVRHVLRRACLVPHRSCLDRRFPHCCRLVCHTPPEPLP